MIIMSVVTHLRNDKDAQLFLIQLKLGQCNTTELFIYNLEASLCYQLSHAVSMSTARIQTFFLESDKIHIASWKSLVQIVSLTQLFLTDMNDQDMMKLCTVLPDTHITDLSIGCRITHQGVHALSTILHRTRIAGIDLEANEINSEGANELLISIGQGNTMVQHVDLSENDQIKELSPLAIQSACRTLSSLNLYDCDLHGNMTDWYHEWEQGQTILQELNLHRNPHLTISDDCNTTINKTMLMRLYLDNPQSVFTKHTILTDATICSPNVRYRPDHTLLNRISLEGYAWLDEDWFEQFLVPRKHAIVDIHEILGHHPSPRYHLLRSRRYMTLCSHVLLRHCFFM